MKKKNINITGTSVRFRVDLNTYELRFTFNKKQHSVYGKNEKTLKQKFSKKVSELAQKSQLPQIVQIIQKSPQVLQFEIPVQATFNHNYTLEEWYNIWIGGRNDLYEKSIESIKTAFRLHILPYLGQKKLTDITEVDITNILNKLEHMKRTQTIVYTHLRACLTAALTKKYIVKDLFEELNFRKHNGEKGIALKKAQQKVLEKYLISLNTPLANFYLFCLKTGARRTEALKLLRKNVNENSVTFQNAKRKKNSPKTFRSVPITIDTFKLIPKTKKPWSNFKENYVTKQFTQIARQLKFEGITLNSLRHSFATRAKEAGIDIEVISKWLGHSTSRVTSEIYIDVQSEFERKEFEKLKDNI